FVVKLPLAPPPELEADLPQRASEDLQLARMRVLIVDDNESAAYLLQRLLNRLQQEVHTANSGVAALEMLATVRPQVVISDIGMPEMSGYELARAIRQRRDLEQPTLIALTGYGKDTDRLDAESAGFDFHLCKPVSIQSLAHILQSAQPTR